jgi:hypothetical protein
MFSLVGSDWVSAAAAPMDSPRLKRTAAVTVGNSTQYEACSGTLTGALHDAGESAVTTWCPVGRGARATTQTPNLRLLSWESRVNRDSEPLRLRPTRKSALILR